jgi:hypothetical protein
VKQIYISNQCYYKASSESPYDYALYSYNVSAEVWRHSATVRNSQLQFFQKYSEVNLDDN